MTVRSGPLRIRYCRPATAVADNAHGNTDRNNTINNSVASEAVADETVVAEAMASQAIAHQTAEAPARRVAYALNKKLGSAVVRNRLRRQIKAILGDLAAKNADFFPEGDYLVGLQPSPQAKGATATERKQVHAWGHHQLADHIHTALGKLQVRLSEAPK